MKKRMIELRFRILVLVVATLFPSMALASTAADSVVRETVTIGDLLASQGNGAGSIPSFDRLDDPSNVVIFHELAGGYNATTVAVSGMIRGDNADANWFRDAMIRIEPNGGIPFNALTSLSTVVGAVGETRIYEDTISAALPRLATGWGQPVAAGSARFEFFELNDEASGAADNTHLDLTIEFIETPAIDGNFNLGSLENGSTYFNDTHSHVEGGLDFFNFTLPSDGTVDIFTTESENGAFGFDITDTEIGLFRATGELIAQNDEGEFDSYSELFDVSLEAGDYTLITTTFNSSLNDTIEPGDDYGLVTGGQFDGDYALTVSFTSSGGGGDAVCDFDGDGDCDTADLDSLYDNFGSAAAAFDVDGSGAVDAADITPWLVAASASTNPFNTDGSTFQLGDANFDGTVDSTDLGLLLNNFGDAADLGYGAGNLNDDGTVDSTDLGLLLNNFGFASASASAVPEPGAGWGLGVGLLMLLWRRK